MNLTTLLNIVRGLAPNNANTPEDKTTQEMLQSLKVDQHKDRVVITGTVPTQFLQNALRPPSP